MSLEAPPNDVAYECFIVQKRDVQICIAREMDPPREVSVRSRRWPLGGVRVYVDGKRWGWRGSADLAGG
jgi:hypothetical protein